MSNAADRSAVQRSSARERAQRKGEIEEVRALMRDPIGRRLAARILRLTGVDDPGHFNANAMALARDHGVRSLGYWLLGEIREACPEQELVMRKESLTLAQRAELQDEVDDADRNNAR